MFSYEVPGKYLPRIIDYARSGLRATGRPRGRIDILTRFDKTALVECTQAVQQMTVFKGIVLISAKRFLHNSTDYPLLAVRATVDCVNNHLE